MGNECIIPGYYYQTITEKRLAQAGYFDILDKYESLHC